MPGSITSRKIMSKWFLEILNSASSPEDANSGEMPYGCSLFCRNVRISGLSSTASTRKLCSSWRGVGAEEIGATGAGGGSGAATGAAAAGAGAIGGGFMGASAIFAAAGSEAARGEVFWTTRRLARVDDVDGATAADSADGDSGVTALFASASADARIFSAAV